MAQPSIPFRPEFDPQYGEAVPVVDGVVRVTCENPSPFTAHGTNSYLLGERRLTVLDPGPASDAHLDALVAAIGGRPVDTILVTHTHADHSPLARPLQERVGGEILAEGPHRSARPLAIGEENPLDAAADTAFRPDRALEDGERVEAEGRTLRALHTPGHTANHLAFAVDGEDILFSGDHVMRWATSIVAPPDGAMRDYMESLEKLLAQPQSLYLPGHGGRLEKAHAFMRALRAHRVMREQAVLEQVKLGRKTIPDMVAIIYATTDKRLHGAAGLSVLAHLEDLVSREQVTADGPPSLTAIYRPA